MVEVYLSGWDDYTAIASEFFPRVFGLTYILLFSFPPAVFKKRERLRPEILAAGPTYTIITIHVHFLMKR
jgi:ABC-type sulfate transport system permease subunit